MTNIFDTHAHYSSRQFDADRDAVMRALGEGGVVGVLECATHSGDAAAVLELAHKYPFVHAALGIHPESLGEEDAATVATYHGDWRAELAAMRPLFANASKCELDSQGRIVIPQKLRKYAGLEKDAVIIGVNDRAEIWSAETWNAREEEEMTPEKMKACLAALGF